MSKVELKTKKLSLCQELWDKPLVYINIKRKKRNGTGKEFYFPLIIRYRL